MLTVSDLAITIGDTQLISSVDFTVPTGECLGIVGETGSGKSLTCRALTGLLPQVGGHVTRGRIQLDDLDLTTLPARQWQQHRGRDIAFIPQNSMSGLDPLMRIGRQLEETIQAVGVRTGSRSRALELLDQVQMPRAAEIFTAYPHELSGGMRQRVMIALAIAGTPRLLIADEPTTALDVTVQRSILKLLSELRRDLGMTMVFVTHDLGVVSEVSTSLAIMYAGMTVEVGNTQAVLADPEHPYTRALLMAHPSGARSNGALAAIDGRPPEPTNWPPGCRFAPRCVYRVDACMAAVPARVGDAGDHWARCIHPWDSR